MIKTLKNKRRILAIIAIIIIMLSVWYHIPVRIDREITICTLEGNTATLELHVSWSNSFIRPSELRGYLFFEGTKYYSLYGKNPFYDVEYKVRSSHNVFDNMFTNIIDKLKGVKWEGVFVLEKEPGSQLYLFYDKINIDYKDRNLSEISVLVTTNGDDSPVCYYGEADNKEQASNILESLYK